MKVLLVNVQKDIPSEIARFENLGLAYLSSFAKEKMSSIEIETINSTDPDIVFRGNPDLIGFSSVSQFMGYTNNLIAASLSKGIPTLLGGIHVSLLPGLLPPGGAIGVLGEGEQTFVELLTLLEAKGRFNQNDLRQIRGIVYRDENNQLIRTAPRPLIEALDTIPMPDRDLLDIEQRGTVYLISSRGCPYKCAFCASTRLYKGIRFFSADYVVNEIKFLVDAYKPIVIKFYDDMFVASKSRLREIVKKLRYLGIHRQVLFSINATASAIDEETAELLQKMNVCTVGMGLESGNQEVLDYLKLGKATVKQNERAINALAKRGINPTGSFIIGCPGENKEKVEDTLEFISSSKLSRSYLYLLTPYPGTPLWDYAREKGLVSDDMDWNRLDINQTVDFSKRIILSESLTATELERLFSKFNSIRRKNFVKRLLVQGLKRPDLILPYLKLLLKRKNSSICHRFL